MGLMLRVFASVYLRCRECGRELGHRAGLRVDQWGRGQPWSACPGRPRGRTLDHASAPTTGPIDVVVHLGSGDPDARARRRENVTEGVDRTLAEAIARDADHLVFVSSAMVYGAWPNNPVPLTEDAILRPDVDFVYARQLAAAEAMADRWRRQRPGRTVAVLRPVVVDGRRRIVAPRPLAGGGTRRALRRSRSGGPIPASRRSRRRPSPRRGTSASMGCSTSLRTAGSPGNGSVR